MASLDFLKGGQGVQLIICQVGAEQNVTQCFTQNGVDMSPGQQVGIQDAIFNVRFDIYKSTLSGKRTTRIILRRPM